MATSVVRLVRGLTPRPAADRAEQERQRAGLVRDHEGALGQGSRTALERLPGLGLANADPALDSVGVEGPKRDARLDDPDRERVVEQVLAHEASLLDPLQGDRLDRGLLLVRVEADVAVEDAIRPRNRLMAQVDRLRPREAVREPREALLDGPAAYAPSLGRSTT